jgi:hypothetical protein
MRMKEIIINDVVFINIDSIFLKCDVFSHLFISIVFNEIRRRIYIFFIIF